MNHVAGRNANIPARRFHDQSASIVDRARKAAYGISGRAFDAHGLADGDAELAVVAQGGLGVTKPSVEVRERRREQIWPVQPLPAFERDARRRVGSIAVERSLQ